MRPCARYLRRTDPNRSLDAARIAGIEVIFSVFEVAGGTYTTALNPERLDLLIEDDVVVAAGFF